jgi:myo-inositol 2-dehydrogenase/D-chiro-inositol 1-dehydrogenase
MLTHDFHIVRWILGDEAATLHATDSCLIGAAVAAAGDIDATAVPIRAHGSRLALIVRALELAEAATASWREQRIVTF